MSAGPATSDRLALVVEDNARCAEIITAMLEADGWQVDHARDGFEAISRFRNHAYGALVLDYRLPGMDGHQVLSWVRRNVPRTPEVVVISSECRDFLHDRFRGMGVRAILPKPPAPADLISALAA
jgi:DNA-binding response OmpR family regulator